MAEAPHFTVTLSSEPAMAALDELKLVEVTQEVVDLFFSRFKSFADALRVELLPAVGTSVQAVLKPTDAFLDFLAAIRAGDFHSVE